MSNYEIDYPTAREMRVIALQWWALLHPEDRVIYCEAHHGVERHPSSLTGREIQSMYLISKT